MARFSELGIHKDLESKLKEQAISAASPIQEQAIPIILDGKRDLVALAQTGSGKTLAFGLPIIQNIDTSLDQTQALIIVPTRELGQQIVSELEYYAPNQITGVFGGSSQKSQVDKLRDSKQIIVATPGRLMDLLDQNKIDLKSLKYLILDEADEILQSFEDIVLEIIKRSPKEKKSYLFSATLPGSVKQLTHNYFAKSLSHIEVESDKTLISHEFIVVEPIEKLEVLLDHLQSKGEEQGIIFCKTKAAVNKLTKNLAKNKFSVAALHGSLSQGIRDRVMTQFRDGHIKIVVATDLAARGIDIKDLGFVINYHLPDTYEAFTHRTGRTARAGKTGTSLTIIQEEELSEIPYFEEALNIKFNEIDKADPEKLAETLSLIWAKKIFKTKPNHDLSPAFKSEIKQIFKHLTKEELIEKVLAHHWQEK